MLNIKVPPKSNSQNFSQRQLNLKILDKLSATNIFNYNLVAYIIPCNISQINYAYNVHQNETQGIYVLFFAEILIHFMRDLSNLILFNF